MKISPSLDLAERSEPKSDSDPRYSVLVADLDRTEVGNPSVLHGRNVAREVRPRSPNRLRVGRRVRGRRGIHVVRGSGGAGCQGAAFHAGRLDGTGKLVRGVPAPAPHRIIDRFKRSGACRLQGASHHYGAIGRIGGSELAIVRNRPGGDARARVATFHWMRIFRNIASLKKKRSLIRMPRWSFR